MTKLKQYATLHLAWIAALLVVVGQTTDKYMTSHPHQTLGGLLGALALAFYNFTVTPPKKEQ